MFFSGGSRYSGQSRILMTLGGRKVWGQGVLQKCWPHPLRSFQLWIQTWTLWSERGGPACGPQLFTAMRSTHQQEERSQHAHWHPHHKFGLAPDGQSMEWSSTRDGGWGGALREGPAGDSLAGKSSLPGGEGLSWQRISATLFENIANGAQLSAVLGLWPHEMD